MEAQEGGSVTLGIVVIKGESVIVRDLAAQRFADGRGLGILTHASRYEP